MGYGGIGPIETRMGDYLSESSKTLEGGLVVSCPFNLSYLDQFRLEIQNTYVSQLMAGNEQPVCSKFKLIEIVQARFALLWAEESKTSRLSCLFSDSMRGGGRFRTLHC